MIKLFKQDAHARTSLLTAGLGYRLLLVTLLLVLLWAAVGWVIG